MIVIFDIARVLLKIYDTQFNVLGCKTRKCIFRILDCTIKHIMF